MEYFQRVTYLVILGFGAFLLHMELRSNATVTVFSEPTFYRGRGPASESGSNVVSASPATERERADYLEIDLGVSAENTKRILKAEKKLFKRMAKSALSSEPNRIETDPDYMRIALAEYRKDLKTSLNESQMSQYKAYLSESNGIIKQEGAMFAASWLANWIN
ncbi:MAG: hypothetical protein KDD25_00720 [Bdellovibrionales bacterium]|nr:hypothetical protein [Bdellovibrionales bacterium]